MAYNYYDKSSISHSTFEGGVASITGAITNSIQYGDGNLQSDPLFVQPVDPASAPTSSGDLRLQPGSPAINAGDSSVIPAGVTTDAAGNQRIVNGVVDIGAYESQPNALTLVASKQLPGLIANLEATMQPVVYYSGYDELAFSLTESPDKMTIDLSSGVTRWGPQEADEGKSYPVTVSVNDGSRFAQTSFLVTVLAPEPVTVVFTDNVLTVVDPSTTLNGMSITQLDGDPILDKPELGKLNAKAAPARPAWVSLLSDVVVVRGSFDADVELHFPLASLPVRIARGDVDLYAFTGALDVEGQFWAPVWMGIEYEEKTEAHIVVVELGRLEGMAAWGYDALPEEGSTSRERTRDGIASRGIGLAAPLPQPAICTVQGQPQDDMYICRTLEATVTIRGWGTNATRWKGEGGALGVTKEAFVPYLLDAQKWFSAIHLGFDKVFQRCARKD